MNIKNLIFNNKRKVICLAIALGIGISCGISKTPKEEYNTLLAQQTEINNKASSLDNKIKNMDEEVSELQDKKNEADRIAKEEAEKVEKEKAEKKAKEEAAAAQAEAERKAQEEQERLIAQQQAEQAVASQQQQSQTSNNYVANNGGGQGVQQQTAVGQMVWLSETGEKYHTINNCGRMNPNKAIQVTLDNAISQGYQPCSKCCG